MIFMSTVKINAKVFFIRASFTKNHYGIHNLVNFSIWWGRQRDHEIFLYGSTKIENTRNYPTQARNYPMIGLQYNNLSKRRLD